MRYYSSQLNSISSRTTKNNQEQSRTTMSDNKVKLGITEEVIQSTQWISLIGFNKEIENGDEIFRSVISALKKIPNVGVIYGGDPYDSEKKNIATLAVECHRAKIPVVAVQCDEYASYMVDDEGNIKNDYGFLSGYVIYPTEKKNGEILFSGTDEKGNPVGALKHMMDIFGNHIKGIYAVGGGPIAVQEYEYFKKGDYTTVIFNAKCRASPTAKDLNCFAKMLGNENPTQDDLDLYAQKIESSGGYIHAVYAN